LPIGFFYNKQRQFNPNLHKWGYSEFTNSSLLGGFPLGCETPYCSPAIKGTAFAYSVTLRKRATLPSGF
jgi:hypothetical protein